MVFRSLHSLVKHNTLSKYPQRGTGLSCMWSSISLLSFKIFCWCISFVNSKARKLSVSNVIVVSFSSMVEVNFQTSCGKSVSTTHSIKGLILGMLHLKRKQQIPDSFNKIASSCGTSDWTCLSTVFLTFSNRIPYLWGTCLLIAFLSLLSSAYPVTLDTSIPTRHFPMLGTCTDRTFSPQKRHFY